MAAVRPEQPVPRITVSRMEFSIASIRFMTFNLVSVLCCRLFLGRCAGCRRWIEPCNIGAERRTQSQCGAILRHDFRGLVKRGFVGALVNILAACEHRRAFVQPLNPYA